MNPNILQTMFESFFLLKETTFLLFGGFSKEENVFEDFGKKLCFA